MIETLDTIDTATTCPVCGKSRVVSVTAWRAHGTGREGEVTFTPMAYETVSIETHCACAGGPCHPAGLL